MSEISVAPGGGTPPHIHHREDEAFRLLEGTLTIQVGGDTITASVLEGLGLKPQRVLKAFDYIAQFDSEEAVRSMKPDFAKLAQLELRGVCVTAPGKDCDFVSRFFAPGKAAGKAGEKRGEKRDRRSNP